jgi:CheY-like chemotaxis protein
MALIVVMEDDAGTRTLIASVLRKEGHEVVSAEDGAKGLALVEAHPPDLIISDVQMPGLNGFEMLAAVRREPRLTGIPVILLTSLQERVHMRIGMTTGADDYITKPFRPGELREAVNAQLHRRSMQTAVQDMAVDVAVRTALEVQTRELSRLYERRLAKALSERWPSGDGSAADERFVEATVLFVDIPNYAAVSERLSGQELAELVKRFYGSAGDTVYLFGARHMQFIGEGLLAVFVDAANTRSVSHGLRAVRAALGLADAARGIRQYIDEHFPARALPRFEVNVALHSGPVTLAHLQDPLHDASAQLLPVGDVVTATMLLQKQALRLGWSIAASLSMLRAVAGAVEIGQRAVLQLPGRSASLEAAEVLALTR